MWKKALSLFLSAGLIWAVPAMAGVRTSLDFQPSVGKALRVELEDGTEVVGLLDRAENGKLYFSTKTGPREFPASNVREAFLIKGDDVEKIKSEISSGNAPVQSSASKATTSPDKSGEKVRWQQELDTAQTEHVALWALAAGGTVVGIAGLVGSSKDKSDAENTPGCSVSGTTIFCQDERSRAQAQSKLDSSKSEATVGVIGLLVGAGFILWAVHQGNEVDSIRRRGRQNGFAWDVQWYGKDAVRLAGSYRFGGGRRAETSIY